MNRPIRQAAKQEFNYPPERRDYGVLGAPFHFHGKFKPPMDAKAIEEAVRFQLIGRPRPFRRVAANSLPQPRPAGYTRWVPRAGYC